MLTKPFPNINDVVIIGTEPTRLPADGELGIDSVNLRVLVWSRTGWLPFDSFCEATDCMQVITTTDVEQHAKEDTDEAYQRAMSIL